MPFQNNSIVKDNRLNVSSNSIETLKYIAILLMILDHFDVIFFEQYSFIRIICRISYPIFAFVVVYNYVFNSKNKAAYLKRLFLFAIISEPFHYYAFSEYYSSYILNIFLTLFIGTSFVYLFETLKGIKRDISLLLLIMIVAFLNPFLSFGFAGVGLIVSIYFFITKISFLRFLPILLFLFYINPFNDFFIRYTAFFSIFAIYIIIRFEIIKVKRLNKYFYYTFYPIHLIALKTLKALIS